MIIRIAFCAADTEVSGSLQPILQYRYVILSSFYQASDILK